MSLLGLCQEEPLPSTLHTRVYLGEIYVLGLSLCAPVAQTGHFQDAVWHGGQVQALESDLASLDHVLTVGTLHHLFEPQFLWL